MDAIREQLNKPLVAGITGAVVGLILGLIWAWVIQPVDFVNAAVEHLRPDLREDYMRMSIQDYNQTLNAERAQSRYSEFGPYGEEALAGVAESPGSLSPTAIEAFRVAVSASPEAAPVEDDGEGGFNPLLLVLCLVIVVVLVVVYYLWYRSQESSSQSEISEAPAPTITSRPDQEEGSATASADDPPLAQFITTYELGHDLFDDSFSIDSPSGEFLGECGVGIAEAIGVGEPKKVSSYEVWLFDKNDIQTVTKVLMSAHAYNDPTTREQLSAKGEPVLAEPGTQLVLETKTLQMVARVVDMDYGDGPLPDLSFFDRITVEMAVWSR